MKAAGAFNGLERELATTWRRPVQFSSWVRLLWI